MMNEAETYPALKDVDWENPDAEAVIAIREQMVALRKAEGKNTGSYYGFITSEGQKHLADTPKMTTRLAEIRQELANLPTTHTFKYTLSPR